MNSLPSVAHIINMDKSDLGCGTGLSGIAFQDYCHSIIDVDLSIIMLAEAGKKHTYGQLIVIDILDFLKSEKILRSYPWCRCLILYWHTR